jgi:3-methyladenine DNA glycosylase AlkD
VDVESIARDIEAQLKSGGEPLRAEQEKRYLKSTLRHMGTSVPATRRIAKAAVAGRDDLSHAELARLVSALWERRVHECRAAAVELLDLRSDLLGPADMPLIEHMLRESKTWALVDGLAASIAGPLVERFPELGTTLDTWAADGDFWIRRSALLGLLLPLRSGGGDFERFGRYAAAMLGEREFFISKAIGWVLRDTSRRRPDIVYAWLLPHASRASRVTIREAVKYLTPELRDAILAAHRNATAPIAKN